MLSAQQALYDTWGLTGPDELRVDKFRNPAAASYPRSMAVLYLE